MGDILLATASDPGMTQNVLRGMYGLRHQVFSERLGWEVQSHDGMERDDFDDLNPTYIVARHASQRVEGCWRLLPTTGPYMLKDTFPQLLCGETAPRDPAVWEISRFAVAAFNSQETTQASLNPITLSILRAGYGFAVRQGIRHFVAVTSVAMERLLKRAGLPLHRFGNKKAQRVGKVLSVACWVDASDQFRDAVNAAIQPEHLRHAA